MPGKTGNTLLESLRSRHPKLVYRGFDVESYSSAVDLSWHFHLEPDIDFTPRLQLAASARLAPEIVHSFAFTLGMVELISYWKAACPPVISVECGSLTPEQSDWWKDLYLHGLGEFFCRNQIDFRPENFLQLEFAGPQIAGPFRVQPDDGDLILVGGGKDSAVTLELLRQGGRRRTALMLNPTEAGVRSAQAAGCPRLLAATRRIDPGLLQLNKKGYLNGHTPFSAYLAFFGLFAAAAAGFSDVAASNEWSANEGNTGYLGMEVNHQYSKTFRFEQRLRSYAARWLTPDIRYFSILRPLLDLQIARLLARFPEQLNVFRSCNRHQKEGTWCGECPKCAFVYICLFPFLEQGAAVRIFGADFLERPRIQEHIAAMAGLKEAKPFECVGTRRETRAALFLSLQKYAEENRPAPRTLIAMLQQTGGDAIEHEVQEVLGFWSSEHALPPFHEALLRKAVNHAR